MHDTTQHASVSRGMESPGSDNEGRRSSRPRSVGRTSWWDTPASERKALPFNKFLVGLQFPSAKKSKGIARAAEATTPASAIATPTSVIDLTADTPGAAGAGPQAPTDDTEQPPENTLQQQHEPQPTTASQQVSGDEDAEPKESTRPRAASRAQTWAGKPQTSRGTARSKSSKAARARTQLSFDNDPAALSPQKRKGKAAVRGGIADASDSDTSGERVAPAQQRAHSRARLKASSGSKAAQHTSIAEPVDIGGRPRRATAQLALHRMRGDCTAAPPDLFAPRSRAEQLLHTVAAAQQRQQQLEAAEAATTLTDLTRAALSHADMWGVGSKAPLKLQSTGGHAAAQHDSDSDYPRQPSRRPKLQHKHTSSHKSAPSGARGVLVRRAAKEASREGVDFDSDPEDDTRQLAAQPARRIAGRKRVLEDEEDGGEGVCEQQGVRGQHGQPGLDGGGKAGRGVSRQSTGEGPRKRRRLQQGAEGSQLTGRAAQGAHGPAAEATATTSRQTSSYHDRHHQHDMQQTSGRQAVSSQGKQPTAQDPPPPVEAVAGVSASEEELPEGQVAQVEVEPAALVVLQQAASLLRAESLQAAAPANGPTQQAPCTAIAASDLLASPASSHPPAAAATSEPDAALSPVSKQPEQVAGGVDAGNDDDVWVIPQTQLEDDEQGPTEQAPVQPGPPQHGADAHATQLRQELGQQQHARSQSPAHSDNGATASNNLAQQHPDAHEQACGVGDTISPQCTARHHDTGQTQQQQQQQQQQAVVPEELSPQSVSPGTSVAQSSRPLLPARNAQARGPAPHMLLPGLPRGGTAHAVLPPLPPPAFNKGTPGRAMGARGGRSPWQGGRPGRESMQAPLTHAAQQRMAVLAARQARGCADQYGLDFDAEPDMREFQDADDDGLQYDHVTGAFDQQVAGLDNFLVQSPLAGAWDEQHLDLAVLGGQLQPAAFHEASTFCRPPPRVSGSGSNRGAEQQVPHTGHRRQAAASRDEVRPAPAARSDGSGRTPLQRPSAVTQPQQLQQPTLPVQGLVAAAVAPVMQRGQHTGLVLPSDHLAGPSPVAAAGSRPSIAAPALKPSVGAPGGVRPRSTGAPSLIAQSGVAGVAGPARSAGSEGNSGGAARPQGMSRSLQLLAQKAAQTASRSTGSRRKAAQGAGSSIVPQGWTAEQMRSLQDAYNELDPIHPRFWQEVAARVPGKTAGECFAAMFDQHKGSDLHSSVPHPARLVAPTHATKRAGARQQYGAPDEGVAEEEDSDYGEGVEGGVSPVNQGMPAAAVALARKPSTQAALRWAREQHLATLQQRAESSLGAQGSLPANLAEALQQKKEADRYITSFLNQAGGWNKWQKACRQAAARRHAAGLAALQGAASSGPPGSNTSSITGAIHAALHEAKELAADLEDEELMQEAENYYDMDMDAL